MVTTKKIAIGYTQKEMRKQFKHFTIKNWLNRKEFSNAESEGQKSYKAICQKQIAKITEVPPSWKLFKGR